VSTAKRQPRTLRGSTVAEEEQREEDQEDEGEGDDGGGAGGIGRQGYACRYSQARKLRELRFSARNLSFEVRAFPPREGSMVPGNTTKYF